MQLVDIIYFFLLIGPLIFVHELGHFIFAKLFNVKVLKFSLGFGKKLIGFKYRETEYQIAWFPLGGFVKMLGEDINDEILPEEWSRSFYAQPVWKRSIIVFAGPGMSLIFPFFLYFIAYLSINEISPAVVGGVLPESPAAQAGIEVGDTILEIEGEKIYSFSDLQNIVQSNPSRPLKFKIKKRDGRIIEKVIIPNRTKMYYPFNIYEEIGQIGIYNAFPSATIGISDPLSPAYKAGLRTFDKVISINGEKIKNFYQLEEYLNKYKGENKLVTLVLRPTKLNINFATFYVYEPKEFLLIPEFKGKKLYTGIEDSSLYISFVRTSSPCDIAGVKYGDKIISWDKRPIKNWNELEQFRREEPEKEHIIKVNRLGNELSFKVKQTLKKETDQYGQEYRYYELGITNFTTFIPIDPIPNPNRFTRALKEAWQSMKEVTHFMVIGIGLLLKGEVSPKTVGGPIMIFDLAGTAGREGTISFLWMMALISINLGIINLLPIPLLDGGHLFLFLIEAIRRKNLSPKTREIVSMVGMIILIAIMIFVFSNDIQRYIDWDKITSWFR